MIKKVITCFMLILICTFALFAATQNFNFSYKWNLPDIVTAGFSKDVSIIDSYLVNIEKNKYALDWQNVNTKPNTVGTALSSDPLKIEEGDDNLLTLTNEGTLYFWLAVRSLNNVKVTLKPFPLSASVEITTPTPSTITEVIPYNLTVDGLAVSTDPISETNKPDYVLSENFNNGEIFASGKWQLGISATITSFLPTDYSGKLVVAIQTF